MIVSNGEVLDFAPQALGEVSPSSLATGYFYADQGIPLQNQFALYGQMYRAQPWLATVVDKVANSGARLSFNSWDKSGGGQKVLDTSSPYAKLWTRPCPVMHTFGFWRWTLSTYEVYGEAFWLKIRVDDRVVGLLPMHPSRTVVKRLPPDEQARLGYATNVQYVFSLGVASVGLLTAPEADVVPFLRYNPDNLMRGLSRVEPLRSTLYNEDASRRAVESWWKRGARPSLMISAPQALSDRAYERLAAKVGAVHGGADQMGGTLVLEEGAKPVPVQLSAEEMQYIQSRTLNREEVCGVYDVPPPVIHILDHATFSNITEQMRSMYRDTMAPRLEDVESVIDYHLRPDFAPYGDVEGRFALDEVLRGDFETRAAAVGLLIEKGVMKPSEARPLFDLDDAGPVADKLYANSALQELGTPATRITVTDRTGVATPGEEQAAADANNAVATEIDQQQADRTPAKRAALDARRRKRTAIRQQARREQWQTETEDQP
jgi:HK97 family phage portal protein